MRSGDRRAAQDFVIVVEDGGLARRDAAGGLAQANPDRVAGWYADRRVHVSVRP